MTQEERWIANWKAVMDFMETNKRQPSKFVDEERGKYYNWIRHNRKLLKTGMLKENRIETFRKLLEMTERYKHVNQYV